MALVIDGNYETLRNSNPEAVFYMEPMEGRNDGFIINATLPGGAILRVVEETKPTNFNRDYPHAVEVDMLTVT